MDDVSDHEHSPISTIVVGVDGAKGGEDALALALRLAREGTSIVAVGVSPTASGDPHPPSDDPYGRADPAREEAVRTQAAAHELPVEFLLARSVADGLHDAAQRHSADLIVIGTSRRSGIGRVLDGDDTRATLRHAPCAVAVAPRRD